MEKYKSKRTEECMKNRQTQSDTEVISQDSPGSAEVNRFLVPEVLERPSSPERRRMTGAARRAICHNNRLVATPPIILHPGGRDGRSGPLIVALQVGPRNRAGAGAGEFEQAV